MWIHHLTHIENLDSILKNGLMSRNELKNIGCDYKDTANIEIIEKRGGLENNIPFHIDYLQKKYGIPYNWSVLKVNKKENMIFLNCATESLTLNKITLNYFLYHPISKNNHEFKNLDEFIKNLRKEEEKLPKYNGGLNYKDREVQQFLMSEILIEDRLNIDFNWKIIVCSEEQSKKVKKILKNNNIDVEISIDKYNYFYR